MSWSADMHAADLILDFAQRARLPGLQLSDAGTAQLLVDGKLALNLEHDSIEQALHLYLSLGPLPATSRASAMRAALRQNLLGRGSGGGAWALDGQADDELLLQRTLLLSGTDGQALEDAVLALVAAAQTMQAVLPALGDDETRPDEAPAPMDFHQRA